MAACKLCRIVIVESMLMIVHAHGGEILDKGVDVCHMVLHECTCIIVRPRSWLNMLVLVRAASFGFAGLSELPDSEEAAAAVRSMATVCQARLNHTLGKEWFGCVIDELQALQKAEVAAGGKNYFPIVPHGLDPLRPEPRFSGKPGYSHSQVLVGLLRDYSCDVEDGGSQPTHSTMWSWMPPIPCPSIKKAAKESEHVGAFLYQSGYLPGGNDISDISGKAMTEAQAAKKCESYPGCAGFTFQAETRSVGARQTMHFKNYTGSIGAGTGWHTLKKRARPELCIDKKPPVPMEFRVEYLRDDPPVYLVHDFLSEADCKKMMDVTLPQMTRSVVSGGSTSYERRSYSQNMYPDFNDNTDPVTQLSKRLFAFAREVAGYEQLHENPGQEPVNAVFYKDYDDQYRAHCDGECHGGPYREGKRIATALTYCETPEQGGYTLFTRSGLKVVPRKGTMLFFGYKLLGPKMDNGRTEHSGCPLRKGRKWIATMWFREGVTPERNWEAMRDL